MKAREQHSNAEEMRTNCHRQTGRIQTGLVSAHNSETGHSKHDQNFNPRNHENMVKRKKLRLP